MGLGDVVKLFKKLPYYKTVASIKRWPSIGKKDGGNGRWADRETKTTHRNLLPESQSAEGIAFIYKGRFNEKKKDVDLHVNMCNK